ncbi:unnamed protein product, partial [Meganyctiphanes norvegica]
KIQDLDECSLGIHGCIPGKQVCYNEVGSYACVNADGSITTPGQQHLPHPVHQQTGFGLQGFPGSQQPSGSGIPATHGRCPPGYKFNLASRVCDDIDECELSGNLCGHGSICQNTIGSYTCNQIPAADCPPGTSFDMALQSC